MGEEADKVLEPILGLVRDGVGGRACFLADHGCSNPYPGLSASGRGSDQKTVLQDILKGNADSRLILKIYYAGIDFSDSFKNNAQTINSTYLKYTIS